MTGTPHRREYGQAMILVLAFMVLSVPLITSALSLASTLSIDSRSKTRILKSHYTTLGAEQYALYVLLEQEAAFTSSTTLNGTTVTTTVELLDSLPGPLPFIASADSNRRLFTLKSASPTSVSPSATTTYTITLDNRDDSSVNPNQIRDEMPTGFSYIPGSTVMTGPTGSVISTADPTTTTESTATASTSTLELLNWDIPPGTTLEVDEALTIEFVATVASTDGVYCNEAYALPGGRVTSSGKTAKVTVGSTTETNCEGAVMSASKTVIPTVVTSATTTQYTYTIEMVNEGTDTLKMSYILDNTCVGVDIPCEFEYVSDSSVSTGVSMTGGQLNPATNVNQQTIKWPFPGVNGKSFPIDTTWTLEFQAEATLARGQYPNETGLRLKVGQLPDQTTWPTALVTVVDVFQIIVTDGETTYTCTVWLGAELDGTLFYVQDGCSEI